MNNKKTFYFYSIIIYLITLIMLFIKLKDSNSFGYAAVTLGITFAIFVAILETKQND